MPRPTTRNSPIRAALPLAAAIASGTLLGGCSWLERSNGPSNKAISKSGPTVRTTPGAAEMVVQAQQARREGETDEAIRLLAAAIEKNPTLTVAHIDIGDLYLEKNNTLEAEKHFAVAASQQPSNFDAQFKHGYALQLLNRLGDCVRAYLRALSIRPDDFQANLNLGTAYLQLKEPSAALPYAQRAVELQSASGAAHANLGSVLTSLDRHEEAVREYRSAAELMELTPQLLLNLSESLGKLNRFEEMGATLDQLVLTRPGAQAYERLGYARFKLREYSAAQDAFRKSIELDRAHYPALNGLGVCLLNDYLASGKRDDGVRADALNMLRQSLRINRSQPKIVELVNRYD